MWTTLYRIWARKYRLAKRHPLFLMRYLLFTLVFRMAGFLVYLLAALLPALPLPDLMNYRMTDFLRQVQKLTLDVGSLRSVFQDMFTRVRLGFTLENIMRLVASLPMELKKLLERLLEAFRIQRTAWIAFLHSLWPPRQALHRLRLFLKRHYRNIRRVTRAVLTFLLTIAILKVIFLFVIPLILSVGFLSFLGFDIMVLLVALGHLLASVLSNFLGKRINKKLHQVWMALRPQHYRYMRCKMKKYTVRLFLAGLRKAFRYLEKRRIEEYRRREEHYLHILPKE